MKRFTLLAFVLMLLFLLAACAEVSTIPKDQRPIANNTLPTLTSPGNQKGSVGERVGLQILANDKEKDTLSFAASGLPDGLSIDKSTGLISGLLQKASVFTVNLAVSDGKGSSSASFNWLVTEPEPINTPPQLLNPGDQQHSIGESIKLELLGSDAESDELLYSAQGLPEGLELASDTGLIKGILVTVGNYQVTVSLSDGKNQSSQSFNWMVSERPNTAPILQKLENQANLVGESVSLTIAASDPEDDPLTYSATGLPEGLSIEESSGKVSGTLRRVSSSHVIISVSDGKAQTSTDFTWAVGERPNTAPSVQKPKDQTHTVGQTVSLSILASDAEGDSLSYSATGLPTGLSIGAASGIITGSVSKAGAFTVIISVSDGKTSSSASFNWIISEAAKPAKLLARWNFEESSGSSAVDSSGNNNTGTISNATRVAGKLGNSLRMNNSVVSIPVSASLRETASQITVMAWVQRFEEKNVAVLAHAYPDVFFGFHGPQFKWQFRNAQGVFAFCYAGNAPLNTWFHMVGTFDGQFAKLYVNGIEICSVAHKGDIPMQNTPFTLGAIPLAGGVNGDALTGDIDDVRIYDRALSLSEIKAVYDATK